ncbi:MAG: glycosyltransferase [Thermodesulfobacteriota bacterium]
MKAVEENPDGITQAEIVIGIPSYNEAENIPFPTRQSDEGLSRYFSDRSAVIVNCDNDSADGTKESFLRTPTKNPKIYISTPPGVTGKGHNLRNLFEKAVELSATAIVVVDADVRSITPRWIRNLGEPLFEEFQYVTPLYVRHKYDGIVTTNIVYPMTRALYGRRVRQPVGGDFGFSGQLAKACVDNSMWDHDVANFGIDLWISTSALTQHVPVIQSFLGRPKVHRLRTLVRETEPVFYNLVGTLFNLMCRYEEFWKDVKWSRPTAVYGFSSEEVEVPPPVSVEMQELTDSFLTGMETNRELYRKVLKEQSLNKLEEVAGLPRDCFEFPTELWAKVLYDFACAYKTGAVPTDVLLGGLMPLFHGKTLSFAIETEAMNTHQAEEFVEEQCMQFERTKPYLFERWFSA